MPVDDTEAAWTSLGAVSIPSPTPLPGSTEADVCVVGLGASGLTAAVAMAERGADVVAVDAHGVAAGAAGRNGGFLLAGLAQFHHDAVAAYGRDRAAMLYRLTLGELDRTLDDLPNGVARRVGSLRIAASDDELSDCQGQLAALRADDLPAEPYDGPEGRGLLIPSDAAVHPVARCAVLAKRALRAGVRLHAPCRITQVGPGLARHEDGEIRVNRVIVAVDGGLESLLPELAGRVRTARLQMLATAPETAVSLPRPVYRRWGYDYVQQLPTGEVMLGGGRDRDEEVWSAPPVPSAAVQAHLADELARMGIRAPVTHRWGAHAAFTTDHLPICEEVRPGVLAIGAYSGHGNVLGTLCGRAAATAALDGVPLRLPPGPGEVEANRGT